MRYPNGKKYVQKAKEDVRKKGEEFLSLLTFTFT